MKDLVLAKVDLPDGWIGASVGEPYLVKNNLLELFDLDNLSIKDASAFEYSKPQGYDPLVKFLEDKHQAPVIITNGAKQSIGALFFALKKLNINNIFMDKPWWSLFPPLIDMHGLNQTEDPYDSNHAYLLVAPNNPNGDLNTHSYPYSDSKYTIHDAAYYNHIYLKPEENLNPIGDVQVFTCSKLFGLSQLRVGYSVFHNTDLYNSVIQYMENMTVGVSVLSQMFALNIFQSMKEHPDLTKKFEFNSRNDITLNRIMVNSINESILTIDKCQTGMFLWAKCHNMKAFDEAKIAVVEGTPFGMSGFIRMNIALPVNTIKEVVYRLNNL